MHGEGRISIGVSHGPRRMRADLSAPNFGVFLYLCLYTH